MVSSSLSIHLLFLAFFLLLLFTPSLSHGHTYDPLNSKPVITHHGGPLLTGTLNLALIWYGNCGRVQKSTIRNFIKSLNNEGSRTSLQPQVSSWWQVVESYQSAVPRAVTHGGHRSPKIIVQVAKQFSDRSYKYGKILTTVDLIPKLVHDYTNGDPHLIPIIVTARDVTVQGLCTRKCADHGVVDNKPYIVVGNPETECPGACGWPFHQADNGPKGMVLHPPNLNLAADAMVIALATALADTVTNPLNTGFYLEIQMNPLGPGSVCQGIFGTGAFPGNPGKVHIDPTTGGGFNAHGNKGKKFLLPAIWNPKTSSCWTLM
ncbi:hypothetical protein CRYUN_Cryun09bG0169600 [Craigia yunnanensis]